MIKVCYTANFGGYDELRPPTVITPSWRYICITDSEDMMVPAPYTRALLTANHFKDSRLAARKMKILCPMAAHLTIWHDANIQVQCNLDDFVLQHHKNPLTIMRHPGRSTVAEEAKAIFELGRDSFENVFKITEILNRENYHTNEPHLAATNLMIRSKNDPFMADFQHRWFQYVESYCQRDQLSFGLSAKLTGLNYGYMPYSLIEGNGFKWRPHA